MHVDYLYTAAEIRQIEASAIQAGRSARQLMQAAAEAAFERLIEYWPEPAHIYVLAGSGNNAGDGFDLARLAQLKQLPVTVYLVGDIEKLPEPARQSLTDAKQAGVEVLPWDDESELGATGVIVDALLGIGSKGAPRDNYASAIESINLSGLPVLSLDIPSGIDPDTGAVASDAVAADVTVCFIGLKRGLFTGDAPDYTDIIELASLDCEELLPAAECELLDLEERQDALLPARQRTAHKGHFGHVLVVGGDHGTGGASLMAADAAGRTGAGLVSAATRPAHIGGFLARKPEVMVHAVESGQDIESLLDAPTVIVAGPGLGQASWGEQLLQQVTLTDKTLVLDADALNILAAGRVVRKAKRDNWVLTPHPGEAARLLGKTTAEVQADRFQAAIDLQAKYGGVIVLKGAGTIICNTEGRLALYLGGNPGMASGGMGDILAGIIGGLLAQGLDIIDAAQLGVCLHAEAADLAATEFGERGLQATDLIGELQTLVNP